MVFFEQDNCTKYSGTVHISAGFDTAGHDVEKGTNSLRLISVFVRMKAQCYSVQIPPEKSWRTLIIRTPIFPLDMLVEDATRAN